jgi:Kef-type K+ transport system membrane component KefB
MSPFLEFLLVLVVILAAARASGLLAMRLGLPAVVGELIAGVILGPTVIDLLSADFLDTPYAEDAVRLLAELGVIFLMFLAGLETDLDEANSVKRVAVLAGTLGVLFAVVMGASASAPFGFSAKECVFIGICLAATSVSVSARTLMDLDALRGRQGIAILATAVVDDVLVLVALSLFVAFVVEGGGSAADVALLMGRIAGFFVAAFVVGRWLLPPLARWSARAPMSEGAIAFAVIVALLYAWSAEYIGDMASITGAFLAGLFLRRTEVRELIDREARALSLGFLAPIFFITIGLTADASGLDGKDFALLAVLVCVAVFSKVAGCGLGARLAGEPTHSALRIGIGMISRGEVQLIVASVGLSHGLIDTDLFSVIVLTVLATSLLTPVLLRVAFAQGNAAPQLQ